MPEKGPLTLPSACENRCTEIWHVPWKPLASGRIVPLTSFILGLFGLLIAVFFLFADFSSSSADDAPLWWNVIAFLGVLLLTFVVAIPGIMALRRPTRVRRDVEAGQRIPVDVYYGRSPEADPAVPRSIMPVKFEDRIQPMLLLVGSDGRMWKAQPDITTFHTAGFTKAGQPTGASEYRNNPWIAPLHALVDNDRQPVFDEASLADRPVATDIHAPPQVSVRTVLERLAPDGHNDPRFVGGPVPGEILLPAGRYKLPFTGHCEAGLVLHRPANAPSQSPRYLSGMHRFAKAEYLFFGTDPGECRGLYMTDLSEFELSDERTENS